jgi:hypothetical protein
MRGSRRPCRRRRRRNLRTSFRCSSGAGTRGT